MRPLLLLDVDGVLNCFGSLWTEAYEAEHFEPILTSPQGFVIRMPKRTARRVAFLRRFFDPVWATAWQSNAHPFFADPLGLDGEPWPHVTWESAIYHPERTWKLPDVQRWLAEHQTRGSAHAVPLAWVDDDLRDDAEDWARRREAPTLLVRTDPCHGLTDEHVHELASFARAVTQGVPA